MKKNILPLLLGFTIAVQSFISPVLAAETLPSDQEVTVEETTETTTETSSEESSDEASSEDSAAALSEPEESASTEVTTPVTTEDIEEESQKETLSDQSEESLSDPALLSNDDSEAPTSVSEEEIRDSADVSKTWGGDLMGLTEAKRKTEELIKKGTLTGTVTVAVIDTGINKSHPWFQGRIDKEHSRSFLSGHSEKDYDDQNGHGSHVAGIIAQNTPENIRLMVLQALDENKNGSSDAVSSAIRYAADNGASIINLSLGVCRDDFEDAKLYSDYVATLQSAISYAKKKDCLIVTSAGNNGNSIEKIGSYPAGSSDVITVSAITDQKEKYEFSNTGSAVDFCAPGEDIYSAWKGGSEGDYVYLSGTSMAAPFVAASISYLLFINKTDSIMQRLSSLCEDLGKTGSDSLYGNGLPVISNYYKSIIATERPTINNIFSGDVYVHLEWSNDYHVPFYLYRKAESENKYTLIATVDSNNYVDKDVIAGVQYDYYIESSVDNLYSVADYSDCVTQVPFYEADSFIIGAPIPSQLIVGESAKYPITVSPLEADAQPRTWDSSNPEVVSVDNEGTLSAHKAGLATINIYYYGKVLAATFDVTVGDSGKCGDNLFWSYNEENATLVISGTGYMYGFDQVSTPYSWPWDNVRMDIRNVVLEEGVSGISCYAFRDMNLETIEGIESLERINHLAFFNSTIDEISLNEGVEFEQQSFPSAKINKLIISSSRTDFPTEAFEQTEISSILIEGNNSSFTVADGILYNADKTVLYKCPTSITGALSVPESVNTICPYAFQFSQLSEISILSDIKNIEMYCFDNCAQLAHITLPDTIELISIHAFSDCSLLKQIQLPKDLFRIEAAAFMNTPLEALELPTGLVYIDGGVFSNTQLQSIYIQEGTECLGDTLFGGCTLLKEVHLPSTLKDLGIPGPSYTIGTFEGCDSITDIYYSAFTSDFIAIGRHELPLIKKTNFHIDASGTTGPLTWRAEGLSGDLTLTISGTGAMPDFASPEEIPWFNGTEEIRHVIVEDGITHIGSYAFYRMENLEDVILPSSVRDYGYSVFRGDPNLEVFRHDNGTAENQLHIAVQYLMALYSGIAYEPEVAVRKGAAGTDFDAMEALTEGTDYTVTYNNTRNIGEGTIVITFLGDYADAGSVTIPFIVASELLKGENIKSLTGMTVNPEKQTYTGAKQTPSITVKSGRWTLKNGVDYKLSTPEMINAGEYAISAEGIGAYSGNEKASFSITSKRMDELSVSLSKDSISLGDAVPVPTVTYNGRKLTDSKDYSVSYKGTDQVGTAEIIIEAKGSNYSGSVSKSFTVTEKKHMKLPALILSKTKTVYNGKDQMPSVTIKDGGTTLKEGTDYTLKMPTSCKNVGTYRITAIGTGDYEGTSDAYFTIEEAPKTDVSALSLSLAQSSIVYDGRSHLDDIAVYSGSKKLKKDTDYLVEVSPSDCTKAGTYQVTVTGIGDYKGTKTLTFTISKPSLSDLKDKASLSQTVFTYDGKKKEPEVFITGLDPAEYEVTYTNNTKAGTGTAIATARESSNYTGSIRLSFTITKDQEKALVSISLSQSRYEYDGTAKRPAATVKSGSTTLKEGRDYTLAYSEGCKDSGTYQVTATGIGSYKGSVTASFTISAKALPDGSRITLSSPKVTFNGQEQRPEVTIEGLVYGRDYTVRYSDNVEPGEGHITITGLGNYRGTTELTFTIEEPSEETTVTTTAEQSTETTSLALVDDRQDTAADSPETTEAVSTSGASDVAGFLLGAAGIVAAVCAGAYFWFFLLAKRRKEKDSEEAK